jgi:DnaJ-class molecular chaperone
MDDITICPLCNGTGCKTDNNGIQYDDVCPECQGYGKVVEES